MPVSQFQTLILGTIVYINGCIYQEEKGSTFETITVITQSCIYTEYVLLFAGQALAHTD